MKLRFDLRFCNECKRDTIHVKRDFVEQCGSMGMGYWAEKHDTWYCPNCGSYWEKQKSQLKYTKYTPLHQE